MIRPLYFCGCLRLIARICPPEAGLAPLGPLSLAAVYGGLVTSATRLRHALSWLREPPATEHYSDCGEAGADRDTAGRAAAAAGQAPAQPGGAGPRRAQAHRAVDRRRAVAPRGRLRAVARGRRLSSWGSRGTPEVRATGSRTRQPRSCTVITPQPQHAFGKARALLVLGKVAQLELREQRTQVHLHRMDAEEQLVGNLLVGGGGREVRALPKGATRGRSELGAGSPSAPLGKGDSPAASVFFTRPAGPAL